MKNGSVKWALRVCIFVVSWHYCKSFSRWQRSFRSCAAICKKACHDDVKWKHFPRYWPFVQGVHRPPVNSPHKGQWPWALMFSLICTWINGSINNRETGDLRRHRAHYDIVMQQCQTIVMIRGHWIVIRSRFGQHKFHSGPVLANSALWCVHSGNGSVDPRDLIQYKDFDLILLGYFATMFIPGTTLDPRDMGEIWSVLCVFVVWFLFLLLWSCCR